MGAPDIPCRVSADLRRHYAEQEANEFTPEDLKDAREDLTEKLLAGEKVGRVDLEAILESELNDNYAATLRSLYEHFANIDRRDAEDCCEKAAAWMQRLVEAHLDANEDVVHDRAAEIAGEKLEDAS